MENFHGKTAYTACCSVHSMRGSGGVIWAKQGELFKGEIITHFPRTSMKDKLSHTIHKQKSVEKITVFNADYLTVL